MRRAWVFLLLIVGIAATPSRGDNWPAWRGPLGTGQCAERDLPLQWSAEEGIAWKIALEAPGNSTPIVWDDRIFLTEALDRGARRCVTCLDRSDGRLIWRKEIPFDGKEPTHNTNPFCSASPVTDGKRVFAWHGSAGVVAYDFEGKQLWHRDLGPFHHIWGNAASPVLYENTVLFHLGPGPVVQLLALDQETGETVWKLDLPASKDADQWKGSWSTPIVRPLPAGGHELLLSTPQRLLGLDPKSGQLRWEARGLSDLVYTSPVYSDEVVVAMSGYRGPAIGVRLGGEGDVTETHRLWRVEPNPQRIGSAAVVGDHAYILNDPGILQCIELKTGRDVLQTRLTGKSWSSMVATADHRLYVIDMDAQTFVLEASPEAKVLARNALPKETTRASLAVSDGQIFARTYQHLYCIGTRRPSAQ